MKKLFTLLVILVAFTTMMSNTSFGQTNPAAFDLSAGSFIFASQTATNTTYPTYMQGWSTSVNNITTAETSAPSADQTLVASGTSSTSGLSNLGTNGFQFISTGSSPNRKVGEICLALNTTGRTNVLVTWTASDQQASANYYSMGLVLQYRVGTSGTFTTVTGTTYTSTASGQAAAQTFTNIALPSACDNQTVVQIRWIYYQISASGASGRDPIRLDDISVSSSVSPLPLVTLPSSSMVTSNSASLGGTLSYLGSSTVTERGIYWSTTNGFADGTGTKVSELGSFIATGSFSEAVTGLSASTVYYFKAFATNSSGTSYTAQGTFTTSCAAISTFPWTENFDGVTIPAFPSCWFKENGDWVTTNNANSTYDADAHSGTQFLRETYTATNEYMWSPGFQLTAGTSYDFSFWWAGDTYAGWVGDVYVNTSQISTGATQLGSSFVTSGTTTTKTYAQVTNSFAPVSSGTYYFAIRVNATSAPWYLSFDDFSLALTPTTPALTAGTLTGFGNACINTTGGPNSFTITGAYLTATDVTVGALTGFSYSTTAGGTYTSSLTLPQPGGSYSQVIYVKFNPTLVQSYNGNIPVGGGGASTVNVAATGSGVNTAPTVTTPTSGSITGTSASLGGNITATGCSNVIERGIYWSTTSGFTPPGQGTKVSETPGPYSTGAFTVSVTGLAASNTYYYKAFATNGSGESYSTQGSFSTLCDVSGIPYTQDFESVTVPAIPICCTIQNAGSGNNWVTSSPGAYGFTSKTLQYTYNSANSANAWFYTNGLNLIGGKSYHLTFRYGNNSTSFTEKLKVWYGTSAINTSMINAIVDYPTINQGTAQSSATDFTPSSTGTYYIGFNVYSVADQYNLYVDDISITANVSPPSSLSASATGPNTIDLTFAPNVNNNNVVIVSNLTGTFTTPSGAPPAIGGSLAGGTLVYNGISSPQTHSALNATTKYYYSAWTYDGANYSSASLITNATTPADASLSYTYMGSGSFTELNNWRNGKGENPADFSKPGQTFNVVMQSENSYTLDAPFIISGAGSKLVLGDATNDVTLIIPNTASYTGTIDVNAGGYLNIQNGTTPTVGDCNSNSTVEYSSSSAQTITASTFGNLIISGTNTATTGSVFTVLGNLTVNNGSTLKASNAITTTVGKTFSLNGTYQHNNAVTVATTIFAGTELFSSTSTFEIQNWNTSDILAPASLAASVTSGGNNYFYANLIINWTGLASTYNASLNSSLRFCAGNFTINSTGTGILQYSTTSTAFTMYILGDYTQNTGSVDFNSSTSAGAPCLINLGGNYLLNSGTIDCSGSGFAGFQFTKNGTQTAYIGASASQSWMLWTVGDGTSTTSLQLTSDFNNGTIIRVGSITISSNSGLDLNGKTMQIYGSTTGIVSVGGSLTGTLANSRLLFTNTSTSTTTLSGAGTINGTELTYEINHTGTGTNTLSATNLYLKNLTMTAGSVTNNASCNVSVSAAVTVPTGKIFTNNGSLYLGPTCTMTGLGAFTSGASSSLGIGSIEGIATGTTAGNIRISGTRTYTAGTTFIYNGNANQVTGDNLPPSITNLTIANSGSPSDKSLSQKINTNLLQTGKVNTPTLKQNEKSNIPNISAKFSEKDINVSSEKNKIQMPNKVSNDIKDKRSNKSNETIKNKNTKSETNNITSKNKKGDKLVNSDSENRKIAPVTVSTDGPDAQSNIVTLSQTTTVTGTATFTSGVLDASLANLRLDGSVSRTNGQIASNGTVVFRNTMTIPDQLFVNNTANNITINKAAATITLGSNLVINGLITFTNGVINTGSNILDFSTSSTNPTESITSYILGNARLQNKLVGTAALTFLGAYIHSGVDDLGNVTITRVTGSSYTFGSGHSINCNWNIVPANQPTSGRLLDLSWLSVFDNGKIFGIGNQAMVFKSEDNGATWVYTDIMADVSVSDPRHINNMNTTSFSIWSMSDQDAPLPVQLSSFTSSLNGRDAKLIWKTDKEINNSGFEVERKTDGSNVWSKIGYVKGSGSTNSPVNYSFEDKKLNSGKYNYRLKQIDYNGNFEYHNLTTVVDVALPTKFNLSQNYPNPFNPTTKIDFDLPFDSKVNIVLYDMTGREVKTLVNESRTAGFHILQFNASDLSSGTYFYRIITKSSGKDFVATKKMMLIK